VTKISHLIVDGSNIATEGRSTPSLDQLESAVAELRRDLPEAIVIVVVDATFAHRIDESEKARFEEAVLRQEYVSPPAGAIGRGDAFLLRIAERVDGTVLSNDSFQEFHGEHAWLFDTGRLLGATPVPGVGWIFVPRSPVRGQRSHVAVRDARKARSQVEKAIAAATQEAVAPAALSGNGQLAGGPAPSAVPIATHTPRSVNEPLVFIEFVASHPLGVTVNGIVQAFTSHGAVVDVGDMRCYVPLSGLADPAPRSAREVLRKGEEREFVVTALDPQRRGVELALPEVAVVSGKPSEETVEADVALAKPARRRRTSTRAEDPPAPAKPAKRVPPSKTVATVPAVTTRTRRTAPAESAPAKATTRAKSAPAKSASAKVSPAKATPAKAEANARAVRTTKAIAATPAKAAAKTTARGTRAAPPAKAAAKGATKRAKAVAAPAAPAAPVAPIARAAKTSKAAGTAKTATRKRAT
jgi:hypothetical protein